MGFLSPEALMRTECASWSNRGDHSQEFASPNQTAQGSCLLRYLPPSHSVFPLFWGLCPYSQKSADFRISPCSTEKTNSEKPVGHSLLYIHTAIVMGPFYFNELK